jgi:hypothetical protein
MRDIAKSVGIGRVLTDGVPDSLRIEPGQCVACLIEIPEDGCGALGGFRFLEARPWA